MFCLFHTNDNSHLFHPDESMADFAKAQLLKYGWTEGKGLGKHESGIPEAIRPKLKFDHAGIGHDSTEQFTYHWWENVFNEAAKNISVQSDNDRVSMNVIDEDTVNITTKKSSVKALKKSYGIQYGNFLKTATLLNNGKVINENCEKSENIVSPAQEIHHVQLTDEELFKACGGRTAHKGARHGLNLNGKLARIAEQERQLLVKMHSNETDKIESGSEISLKKECNHNLEAKKSKKRVTCKRKNIKSDSELVTNVQKTVCKTLIDTTDPQPSCSYTIDPDTEENLDSLKSKRKRKKRKKNNSESILVANFSQECRLSNDTDCIKDDSTQKINSSSNIPSHKVDIYDFKTVKPRKRVKSKKRIVKTDSKSATNDLNMIDSIRLRLDDNVNAVDEGEEFIIPPTTEESVRRIKSKKSVRKDRKKINKLTDKLDASCVIDESMKVGKKRKREESQQIVQDILTTVLEKCNPLTPKCKKRKIEKSSDYTTYDADKLNAKILRKKKHSCRRKQKDKLDRITRSITKELMSVNLDESCGKK